MTGALTKALVCLALLGISAPGQPRERLANIRQLTSGGQNAEAYWSPDGKRLIFQSTREGYSCDQIYIMNADGSGQRMVSTGKGVTTCGYFLAGGKQIVYASTHEASPECPPRPDRSKGYVWGVHAGFDLYLADDTGKNLRKLTDSAGYDAEATVNWKTKKILFTSLASGDLDLWTMDQNGSSLRPFTASLGYDGGAFFSRDGRQIVWRANHPQQPEQVARYKELLAENLTAPMKMEIFVGNADGSGTRQVTNFGCASFAPQFTADGRRIIFSSNKNECDSRKFELFIIDLDGGNVEQVTNFGGFTSFGEFSPDGKRLVFTSDREAKGPYEFNIFVADWLP